MALALKGKIGHRGKAVEKFINHIADLG